MPKETPPAPAPLTDEEKAKVQTFLKERDKKRFKIELLLIAYMGVSLLVVMLLDFVAGMENLNVLLVFVIVAAVFFPLSYLAYKLWARRQKPAAPADEEPPAGPSPE